MPDHGDKEAWKLFNHNWLLLCCIALTLALGLALTNFSLQIDSQQSVKFGAALLFGGLAHYLFSWGYYSRMAFALCALAQLMLVALLMPPLTYMVAAANLPMQDANLAAFDAMLGLDWIAYFNFVYDRPALIPYAYLSYAMIVWPIFIIPVVLGLVRQHLRLRQFVLACMLTLIVTTIVSALLPALGTYHEYGVTPDPAIFKANAFIASSHDVPLIRDGLLRTLDTTKLAGIITFPSFHAAAAILSLWALWSVWWMRPFALLTNGGMLLATPVVGGHYFVDIFAGVGLAILAIAAAQRAARIGDRTKSQVREATVRAVPIAARTAAPSEI